MKSKIHIATKEYCFIEFETEVESMEESLIAYDKFMLLLNDKEGLNTKDWARVRNNFILNNEIDEEDYNKLSKAQRYVINEVKIAVRSLKE